MILWFRLNFYPVNSCSKERPKFKTPKVKLSPFKVCINEKLTCYVGPIVECHVKQSLLSGSSPCLLWRSQFCSEGRGQYDEA